MSTNKVVVVYKYIESEDCDESEVSLETMRFPRNAQIDVVIGEWCQKLEKVRDEHIFFTEEDKQILLPDEYLGNILPKSSSFALSVCVERISCVFVTCYGTTADRIRIPCHSLVTSEQVVEEFMKNYRYSKIYHADLWYNDLRLPPDNYIFDMGIPQREELLLSFRLDIIFKLIAPIDFLVPLTDSNFEYETDDEGNIPCVTFEYEYHVSDICTTDSIEDATCHLLNVIKVPNCRILHKSKKIAENSRFGDVIDLDFNDLNFKWTFSVEVCVSVMVARVTNRAARLEPMEVWPFDKVSIFRRKSEDHILWEGMILDTEATVSEVGLQNQSLIIVSSVDPIAVTGVVKGSWRVLQIPLPLVFLQKSNFNCAGEYVNIPSSCHAESHLSDFVWGKSLEEKSLTVNLTFEGKKYDDVTIQANTHFCEILNRISKCLHVALPQDTTIECSCGMKFSREYPSILENCCPEKVWNVQRHISLRLRTDGRCSYHYLPTSSTAIAFLHTNRISHLDGMDDYVTVAGERLELNEPWYHAKEINCRSLDEAVDVEWERKITIRLELGNRTIPWRTSKCVSLLESVTEMENAGISDRIKDLEIFGYCVDVRGGNNVTYRDHGIPNDCLIQVLEYEDNEEALAMVSNLFSGAEDEFESEISSPELPREEPSDEFEFEISSPELPREEPSVSHTWTFKVDCRRTGGMRDFSLDVKGNSPIFDGHLLTQSIYERLGSHDLRLSLKRAQNRDEETVYDTVRGWADYHGRIWNLSDITLKDRLFIEDDTKLILPEELAVNLQVEYSR